LPLGRALLTIAGVYVAICVGMFVSQRRLQYFPNPAPMDPAEAGLTQVQVERLATADGERIVVWWVPPRDDIAPVYLYLHGNGNNLERRAPRFAQLVADGSGLYAVSWRGYGGSTGRPSEAGLLADARAAYKQLRTRVAAERIVLYGESLGTTIAIMLATDNPVRALLLDSSFSSALDVARGRFPWLPVALLLEDTYRADLAAPHVDFPVLQVHCTNDPITPLRYAERLHARLPRAEPLHRIDRRCHVPSLADYDAVRANFLRSVVRTAP
jgi:pimeloyl-ACP methyl ester carboxylesterase